MKDWMRALGAIGSFQVEVPDAGVLDFRRGEESIVFLSQYGDDLRIDDHPLGKTTDPILSKVLEHEVVLAAELERRIYSFSLTDSTIRPVLDLYRDTNFDHAYAFLQFVEAGAGLLIAYEGGLALIDSSGEVRWHVPDDLYLCRRLCVDEDGTHYTRRDGVACHRSLIDGSLQD